MSYKNFTNGELLQASDLNNLQTYYDNLIAPLPKGILALSNKTTNTGSITTTETTVHSVTVTVPAGRYIEVSFSCMTYSTVATDVLMMALKEGSTQLMQAPNHANSVNAETSKYQFGSVFLTPSAGSHTYLLRCVRAAGTGTITVAGSTADPVQIVVKDLGAA